MVEYFEKHHKEYNIHEWIRIAMQQFNEEFTQKQMRHFFSIRGLPVKPMRETKRKIFNRRMYEYLKIYGETHTVKEWVPILKEMFDEDFTLKQMQTYFNRHQIPMKYESPKKAHTNTGYPIGSERTKSDGMVQVKVAPHKWEYKQRYIYEQYYGVDLPEDVYVIFLDQDRTNFDISNLRAVTRHEAAKMVRNGLFSKESKITELGINVAKLQIKNQEKRYEMRKQK